MSASIAQFTVEKGARNSSVCSVFFITHLMFQGSSASLIASLLLYRSARELCGLHLEAVQYFAVLRYSWK